MLLFKWRRVDLPSWCKKNHIKKRFNLLQQPVCKRPNQTAILKKKSVKNELSNEHHIPPSSTQSYLPPPQLPPLVALTLSGLISFYFLFQEYDQGAVTSHYWLFKYEDR